MCAPVPAGAVRIRKIQHVQVLRSQASRPDASLQEIDSPLAYDPPLSVCCPRHSPQRSHAHLDHHHVAHSSCSMCCAGRGGLAQRGNFVPSPISDVEYVHVVGGPGQPNAWGEAKKKFKSILGLDLFLRPKVSNTNLKQLPALGRTECLSLSASQNPQAQWLRLGPKTVEEGQLQLGCGVCCRDLLITHQTAPASPSTSPHLGQLWLSGCARIVALVLCPLPQRGMAWA